MHAGARNYDTSVLRMRLMHESKACRSCRMDMLGKYDMTADADQGLVATLKLPEGYVGGEFIFVSSSGPSSAGEIAEDEGWLLGHVTDETTMKSYVLV